MHTYLFKEFSYTQDNNNNATAATDAMARLCHTWPALAPAGFSFRPGSTSVAAFTVAHYFYKCLQLSARTHTQAHTQAAIQDLQKLPCSGLVVVVVVVGIPAVVAWNERKNFGALLNNNTERTHTRALTHTLTAWENKKRKMYKPKRSKSVAAKVERGKRQAAQVKSS